MAAIKGKAIVISINAGTAEAPQWVAVAGQQGGTLNRSVDTIETTTKDSVTKEFIHGDDEWSIECDGLYQVGDEGFAQLEDAYMAKEMIQARIALPGKAGQFNIYTGMALITELPIEIPSDDTVTYSTTLQGTGLLAKTTGASNS